MIIIIIYLLPYSSEDKSLSSSSVESSGRWRVDERAGRLEASEEGGWRRGVDAESPGAMLAVFDFSLASKYLFESI
jgi:hypothetical protein